LLRYNLKDNSLATSYCQGHIPRSTFHLLRKLLGLFSIFLFYLDIFQIFKEHFLHTCYFLELFMQQGIMPNIRRDKSNILDKLVKPNYLGNVYQQFTSFLLSPFQASLATRTEVQISLKPTMQDLQINDQLRDMS